MASFSEKTKQVVHQKLIEPIIHSKSSTEEKARGVAVGLAWAMTPLVGIQMVTVTLTWLIAKKLKWSFSLPLALAWTWVTNVITLVPVYYVFYVVGQFLRGKWSELTGYESVSRLIENVFLSEASFWEKTKEFITLFVEDWGISMFLGCIPFIIGGYIVGYRFTIRLEKIWQKRKGKKKNETSQRIEGN